MPPRPDRTGTAPRVLARTRPPAAAQQLTTGLDVSDHTAVTHRRAGGRSMTDPSEQITNPSAPAVEAYDPVAAHAQRRNWARKSRELAKQRNRAHIQRIKLERGCTDCGYRTHPDALDFDHLPEHGKAIAVGLLAASGASIKRLDEEIARCEVVCANCHRIRTSDRTKAGIDQDTQPNAQPHSEVAS